MDQFHQFLSLPLGRWNAGRLPRRGRLRAIFLATALAARAAAPDLLVENLTGPVTDKEIAAFARHMQAAPLPTDNRGNAMVYGAAGAATEALGAMVEITRDRALLDRMLEFTDAMLAARNDPVTGRVLWTGRRELVWPNKAATDREAGYSSTENGDVVGHIAYAALLILSDPALAQLAVGRGDTHGFGATYGQRARHYVRELDRTVDSFLLSWLVRPDTLHYRFPDSDLWAAQGTRYAGNRNRPVPWNQQMMLNHGFQRLAECHEQLGDAPERVKRYDAIVRASCEDFFRQMTRYEAAGRPVYKWSYLADDPAVKYVEDTGHAGYDMLVFRAYTSGRYGITAAMMQPLANTLKLVIQQKDSRFAPRVDGAPRSDRPPTADIGSPWLYLSDFDPDLFPILATANREAAKTKPDVAARILWMKHRRATAAR